MQLGTDLYKALMLRYKHVIADAKVRLKIYFENPVGIGEHPQHTEEMDKLLSQLSDAQDNKEALEKNFKNMYGLDHE
tara:strand:+ start:226 stop:456 length:231 start_codon:yes stop_codon:yes gene_type:complete